MIQFNLLPDLKLTYIKAERQKKLVLTISMIVTIASLTILAFLLVTVNVIQKKSLGDLAKDIDSAASQLQDVEDLDKILTVQSQLNSLTGLHDQKVVSSRLYDYLVQVTPAEATISNVKVDYAAGSLEVTGKVQSLSAVNKYADSYKFTTFKESDEGESSAAFANVVLSNFTRQSEGADYTLTMNYNPKLFAVNVDPQLTVPNMSTAGPDVERPQTLFEAQVTDAEAM